MIEQLKQLTRDELRALIPEQIPAEPLGYHSLKAGKDDKGFFAGYNNLLFYGDTLNDAYIELIINLNK